MIDYYCTSNNNIRDNSNKEDCRLVSGYVHVRLKINILCHYMLRAESQTSMCGSLNAPLANITGKKPIVKENTRDKKSVAGFLEVPHEKALHINFPLKKAGRTSRTFSRVGIGRRLS